MNFVGFDTTLMNSLVLLSATPAGVIEWELIITSDYGNLNGVMHGGAAGVIFDMCTTTALGPLSRKGYWECVIPSLNLFLV
jgi:acyl-coenzyme A thioesterase 13